jgi:hypothetical protein
MAHRLAYGPLVRRSRGQSAYSGTDTCPRGGSSSVENRQARFSARGLNWVSERGEIKVRPDATGSSHVDPALHLLPRRQDAGFGCSGAADDRMRCLAQRWGPSSSVPPARARDGLLEQRSRVLAAVGCATMTRMSAAAASGESGCRSGHHPRTARARDTRVGQRATCPRWRARIRVSSPRGRRGAIRTCCRSGGTSAGRVVGGHDTTKYGIGGCSWRCLGRAGCDGWEGQGQPSVDRSGSAWPTRRNSHGARWRRDHRVTVR